MAAELSNREAGGDSSNGLSLRPSTPPNPTSNSKDPTNAEDDDEDDDEEEEEEEEDEEEEDEEDDREPTLKYAKLTSSLAWIYRNGDSSSTFMTSGDKMFVGTHDGNVHVLSIPSLQSIRTYRAHSSTITCLSVSPYLPALPASAAAVPSSTKSANTAQSTPNKQTAPTSTVSPPNSPSRAPVPTIPANAIYIASSSIDGHVCVSSLVDPKDVTLRNYARPVHAVSLSPAFKSDRTYLSGGTAGQLILTVGGKPGVSADANTNSAAAAASGWLGSIGLSSNTGKDTILHAGEGTITSIKWSLSGKYVVWNNEYGTRIMRSHLHLGSEHSHLAWKRIGHVPRPNRKVWEDMAGVWKARAEWIDEKSFESTGTTISPGTVSSNSGSAKTPKSKARRQERLLLGWGDTVWMIHINSGDIEFGENGTLPAKAEIFTQFSFSDCIVSGLTLYTPSLLVALVYRSKEETAESKATSANGTPRRGRQNGLPPDLRLINLDSKEKEELETESLVISRFERLSAADYFLSRLFIPPALTPPVTQRGTFESIGGGLIDVTLNPTRLFSSSASVLSGTSSEGRPATLTEGNKPQSPNRSSTQREIPPSLANPGLKIFIQSPFDCIVAVKRDVSDQLQWFLDRKEYEEAWNLVNDHPEIISAEPQIESRPETPTRSDQSLKEFFKDESSSQVTLDAKKSHNNAVEREKQRIGSLWIDQLISANEWSRAGEIAGMVLGDSQEWSNWILTFANAHKFDEITPFIPAVSLKPPLPSEVYDVVLGHYIKHNKERLQDLLEQWSPTLFDVPTVISAIKDSLDSDDPEGEPLEKQVEDHEKKILLNSLAKLYLADNNPSAAIRCYVRTRNADEVMNLIRDYQNINAISDDIFVFILIRTTQTQRETAPLKELDVLSSEPIGLLTAAAIQGIIPSSDVVAQLEPKAPASSPYLFFYFRKLWQGDVPEDIHTSANASVKSNTIKRSRFAAAEVADIKSRTLIAPHADLVVSLFAEYSQPLLNDFLKTKSVEYDYTLAAEVCRRHHLIPELVHILSVTGQSSQALQLIITELDDVSMAVTFAKEADEPSLWFDLLDYSMDKPNFIRGLLEEVGTSINPVTLVRRIPEGLEVPGLKNSLTRLVRDSQTTWSITEGASKILKTEVATVLTALRRSRERGLVFDINQVEPTDATQREKSKSRTEAKKSERNECTSCLVSFSPSSTENPEQLIGFACGHLFHVSCLLDDLINDANKTKIVQLQSDLRAAARDSDGSESSVGRVGAKVRHAQMIQSVLGDFGCPECTRSAPNADDSTQNG